MKAKLTVALVAAASLLLPVHALAAATPRGGPAGHQARMKVKQQLVLEGTNNFQVGVELVDGRKLTVTALNQGKGLGIEGVEYKLALRRRVAPGEIVAQLGHLGRIDVHFVPGPTKKKTKPPQGCSGEKAVTEEGHYVGVISFHGERGFTRVDATHAPGQILTEPLSKCSHPVHPVEQSRRDLVKKVGPKEAGAEGEEGEVAIVKLKSSGTKPATSFEASRIAVTKPNGHEVALATFLVTAKRHLGPIEEEGVAAILLAKGSSFLAPEPLDPTSDLVVEPPAPFTGSATYRQATTAPATWSGDLKIDLPGFGLVPLAGHRSKATATLKHGAG
jgi:hypothetical protein